MTKFTFPFHNQYCSIIPNIFAASIHRILSIAQSTSRSKKLISENRYCKKITFHPTINITLFRKLPMRKTSSAWLICTSFSKGNEDATYKSNSQKSPFNRMREKRK